MRITHVQDPFLHNQPVMTFAEDLAKPLHTEKPPRWNTVPAGDDEVDFSKVKLQFDFEDEILETAYDDFKKFLDVSDAICCENGKIIRTAFAETECFESYRIVVDDKGCTIFAADTEGIRRGLVFVEDEMLRREGTILKIGTIERKPHITARISRCYFTPASCVENEVTDNELLDDVDYYPDEYLNRLAHDGINALWLGASMRLLAKNDRVPEYGKNSERMLNKLRGVVDKCKRYGIKIYLFSVDPASSLHNDDVRKHQEILGDPTDNCGILLVCPSSDDGEAYMRESIQTVFKAVPGLAGYINLSVGESLSHCGSRDILTCRRCAKKFGTLANTLAHAEKIYRDAIHEVAPDAEYISWTYGLRYLKNDDVIASCNSRFNNVTHLINFEDHARVNQLGKDRVALDYWLSFAGPGEMFKTCLDINKKRGIDTWAKIQVCSSHEISTVPYVPVPGLLYEKYKYMYENNIHGVMQCWFFGNYPCLMNKAAGELAFEPFFDSKEKFLTHLAGIYWGRDAEKVAKAWNLFTEGYKNFPVGVMFEWFGPMQDSPVAPLHLKPVDRTLAPTWLLNQMSGGDRIGDCILNSHTIDEVVTLTSEIVRLWNLGIDELSLIPCLDNKNRTEQMNIAKAISLIFESGRDTFRFYELRHMLGLGKGDAKRILAEMRSIVEREIEISTSLIPISAQDNRIGYHSEAHGYKLFPEKLEWRIERLKELLATEFPEIEDRVSKDLVPLEYYYGSEPGSRVYRIQCDDINDAEWIPFIDTEGNESEKTFLRISSKNGIHTIQFLLKGENRVLRFQPEFTMFYLKAPLWFENGKASLNIPKACNGYGLFDESYDEWLTRFNISYSKDDDSDTYTLSYKPEDVGATAGEPFRFMARRGLFDGEATAKAENLIPRLGIGPLAPEQFLFVIPQ